MKSSAEMIQASLVTSKSCDLLRIRPLPLPPYYDLCFIIHWLEGLGRWCECPFSHSPLPIPLSLSCATTTTIGCTAVSERELVSLPAPLIRLDLQVEVTS